MDKSVEEGVLHPSERELQFLSLAYNRFYDLYDEINTDAF